MDFLIIGLTLFFAVHLIPPVFGLRDPIVSRIGEGSYKGAYALLSLAGMAMVVTGLMGVEFISFYEPPAWGRHVTMLLMLLALIIYAAFKLPSNLRRITPHPMLWGVTLWATAHLLANGDVASVVLFSSFLAYALITIGLAWFRGVRPAKNSQPWWRDALLAGLAVVLYVLLIRFHESFTGVALIA